MLLLPFFSGGTRIILFWYARDIEQTNAREEALFQRTTGCPNKETASLILFKELEEHSLF